MANEEYGQQIKGLYGDDVGKLLIEQLQSDEESTDSELGLEARPGHLMVMNPTWRSYKVRLLHMFNGIYNNTKNLQGNQVFRKFDEFDILLRKNARKERETKGNGRRKDADVKDKYLAQAPDWAKGPGI